MTEIHYYQIGGMVPWCCSYMVDGTEYGITLWATDPDQLIEDNCDLLHDLQVHGQLVATYDFGDDE